MTSATAISGEPYVFVPPTLRSLNPTATPTITSNANIFIPSTLSLTLAGPGALTTSLPIEFPVISLITSGNVIQTSLGFTTYSNPAAVSAAASAARGYFSQINGGSTGINTDVPTAILSDTTSLTIPSATSTLGTTASPAAVRTTATPDAFITSMVTVSGSTSTSTLGTNAIATTSKTSSESSLVSANTKATATPTGSGSCKNTSIKKGLAIFCVLVVAASRLF